MAEPPRIHTCAGARQQAIRRFAVPARSFPSSIFVPLKAAQVCRICLQDTEKHGMIQFKKGRGIRMARNRDAGFVMAE